MTLLSEEEVDDILYFARANEIDELKKYIPTLYPKYGTQPAWILAQAADADTGNTALHYASANGHLDMAKHLTSLFGTSSTDQKSYINRQNQAGNTSLHWSALNGHMEIVKYLLSSGADASILNASGHDAVYQAEMNDKQDVAEYLLQEALGIEQGLGVNGGQREHDEDMAEVAAAEAAEGHRDAEKVSDGMQHMSVDDGQSRGSTQGDA